MYDNGNARTRFLRLYLAVSKNHTAYDAPHVIARVAQSTNRKTIIIIVHTHPLGTRVAEVLSVRRHALAYLTARVFIAQHTFI